MPKPLHDALITNLPTFSLQWVKIYLLQFLWIYQWLSTKLLTHWSYCSLAPSHQHILPLRPFIPLFIFLGLLPPITSKIFIKPIMATHWSFEKKVEIMQTGFDKWKYFNFKQKNIWIHFWGVTNALVRTMALNQQRKKPLTHWHLGNQNVIVKMFLSILICWLVSSDFPRSTLVQPGYKLLPDQTLIWIHIPTWRHALCQNHNELSVPMSSSSLLHAWPSPRKSKLVIMLMMYYQSIIVKFVFVISHWNHCFCININSCKLWQSHSLYEYDATIFNGPLPINGPYISENGVTIHKMLKSCRIYCYTNTMTQSDGQMLFYQGDDSIIMIINLFWIMETMEIKLTQAIQLYC